MGALLRQGSVFAALSAYRKKGFKGTYSPFTPLFLLHWQTTLKVCDGSAAVSLQCLTLALSYSVYLLSQWLISKTQVLGKDTLTVVFQDLVVGSVLPLSDGGFSAIWLSAASKFYHPFGGEHLHLSLITTLWGKELTMITFCVKEICFEPFTIDFPDKPNFCCNETINVIVTLYLNCKIKYSPLFKPQPYVKVEF